MNSFLSLDRFKVVRDHELGRLGTQALQVVRSLISHFGRLETLVQSLLKGIEHRSHSEIVKSFAFEFVFSKFWRVKLLRFELSLQLGRLSPQLPQVLVELAVVKWTAQPLLHKFPRSNVALLQAFRQSALRLS